jgi:hypothetical protein
LISPPAKAPRPITTPRKRAAANARGKALAKEKEVGVDNKDPAGTATILAAHPAKKVSRNEIVFVNIE